MRFYPYLPYRQHRAFAEPRAWEPLSDDEWCVLNRFVFRNTAGRPIENPRRRLDAIFWLAAQDHRIRWADLPEHFGKPDTVSRQFRRWATSGLWTELLKALANRHYPGWATLHGIANWICRAYRRAWRLQGLAGIVLARRLGFLSALRAPPWLLPDPDLSERLLPVADDAINRMGAGERLPRPWLRSLHFLLRSVGGARSVPRALVWP